MSRFDTYIGVLIYSLVFGMNVHLLEWIEKGAPDPVIEFAVKRLPKEEINKIKDKELRKKALAIKKQCEEGFK